MKFSATIVALASVAPLISADVIPTGPLVQQCCTPAGRRLQDPATLTGSDNELCYNSIDQNAAAGYDCIDSAAVCASQSTASVTLTVCGDNDELCCRPCTSPTEFGCLPGNMKPILDVHWTCTPMSGSAPAGTFFCGWGNGCKIAGICGDPHFKTWAGEWFDFHGECDLTLLSSPKFGLGLGMDIQVRTTIREEYSYIETAALRIGDDILEVGSYGQYFLNGVESAKLDGVVMGHQYPIEHSQTDKKHIFKIGIHGGEHVEMLSIKDLVSVNLNNATWYHFGESTGMMGDYVQGKMLARDGLTVISDPTKFGQEWQVRDNEPKLFQTIRAPQFPAQECIMPSKSASAQRRRLAGVGLSNSDAEAACASVSDKAKFDNCVYDVLATGDVENAAFYA